MSAHHRRLYQERRREWEAARRQALADASGRCLRCGDPATEVHHLKPLQDGGALTEQSNLAPLCKRCHKAQHRALRGGIMTTPAARRWQTLVQEAL